ncbi:MAG: ferrous iron transporter B, partial [Candidatus Micrarchaeota archaeon]
MRGCCGPGPKFGGADIALAGNPNVGKSALMNQLTGVGVFVSNYPGTTVEIVEGDTVFGGMKLRIADLPGVYSLNGASEDEAVALDYLISAKPRVVVNIVDATKLERNLFLTLQLLNLGVPVIVALNFQEEARDSGVEIDEKKLSNMLGVPVMPINPISGTGVGKLVRQSAELLARPKRWGRGRHMRRFRHCRRRNCEEIIHKEAAAIAAKAALKRGKPKIPRYYWLDKITGDPASGTVVMLAVLAILFASLFIVGGGIAGVLGDLFTTYAEPPLLAFIGLFPGMEIQKILQYMLIDGLNAGLQIAIPYVFVFYLIIALMEDSGYMPRMAFLLDRVMHRLGLHGKAVVPMMLGFGCSVPAIISTRVLSSKRERLLAAIMITLIPCSARTAVILGAVGVFLGWQFAVLIYAIILLLVLATGLFLGRLLPGERLGFIMEIPPYRMPSAKNVLTKTLMRVKDFVFVALPLVLIGSGIIGGIEAFGLMPVILKPFEPLVSGWLMLPAAAGITLVFGVL